MPIYEYRCGACSKKSSALLPSFSSPDPSCPHCGKGELKRLISTFATVRSEDSGGEDDFGGDEGMGGEDDFGGDEGMGGDDESGDFGGGDDDF